MIDQIENEIENLKLELIEHPLYKMMESKEDIQVFMEHHIYAVWDFMSLVKKLQLDLTTTTLPWVPNSTPFGGRLINEIVWGEETDINKDGVAMSHFEMYVEAMDQVGADTNPIKNFLNGIEKSESIESHINSADFPVFLKNFLNFTFGVIESNKTHVVAAVFTFGREDLIPVMFIEMVKNINNESNLDLSHLIYYLERHIEVDAGEHGPMALKMIQELCGNDPVKWEESLKASKTALLHRVALWDGINSLILKPITN